MVLYITTAAHDGDFDSGSGARTGLDTFCTSNKPTNLPAECTNHHAFVSVDASDEIRDMTSEYGYVPGSPIYWWHDAWQKYRFLATDWEDMLDGSSIAINQSTGTGENLNAWSASYSDGSLYTSGSNTCVGWTVNTGVPTYGRVGKAYVKDSGWLEGHGSPCSTATYLRCACQIEVDGSDTM